MSEVLGPLAAIIFALVALGYFAQSRLPPPKPVIIGIDLGTTFSCVGVYNAISGDVTVLEDEEGKKLVPSAVSFYDNKATVGYPALQQEENTPEAVIYDAKRFIGKIGVTENSIDKHRKLYPFKLNLDKQGKVSFGVVYKTNATYYHPEDIGAFILSKLKRMAEQSIERKIDKAVISVPAEFNSLQRNATIEAGRRAGLKVMRVINEPTAAALAYGLHKKNGTNNVLVVDFGGGTLDVSLLNIQGGMFYTMAMAGNNRLGGQDVNQNLMLYILSIMEENHGLVVSKTIHLQKIRLAVEEIKINLTSSQAVEIVIHFDSLKDDGSEFTFMHTLTRHTFEKINSKLFEKILEPVKRVLKEVEMNEDEVDEIVLVGGSTRIPKVRQIIEEYFGKKPNLGIDPELAVVTGVSIQAGILGGMWPLRVAAVELPTNHVQKIEIGEEL